MCVADSVTSEIDVEDSLGGLLLELCRLHQV